MNWTVYILSAVIVGLFAIPFERWLVMHVHRRWLQYLVSALVLFPFITAVNYGLSKIFG